MSLPVADGKVVLGLEIWVIFPRSAMKPLQAIALVEVLQRETGAKQLSDSEVAIVY